MGDENQPSKKRAAGRELSRDNPGLDDEEDAPEQEMGTFKKASDDVLATRKIVKVRRQPSSTPSAPSSNPFAGIRLVPPPAPAAPPVIATTNAQPAKAKTSGEASGSKDETNTEEEVTSKESEEKQGEGTIESNADKEKAARGEQEIEGDQPDQKSNGGPSDTAGREAEPKPIVEKTAETDEKQEEDDKAENNDKEENENPDASAGGGGAALSSFQQLSNSQNAFTGVSGTGFSSSSFSFGSVQKDGSPSQFSFGTSNNGSSGTSLFGTTGASIGVKSEGSAFPTMQEVPRETGEENEETVFSAESAFFEYLDGGWKERGKGEVKLNVLKADSQKARLVMRAKGNLRLMLNASIFPDMKLTKMDKKGVTFACVNMATEGKDGLSTFALKFKDVSIVEEFLSAVSAYKDKPASTALKTPENSPKASDE